MIVTTTTPIPSSLPQQKGCSHKIIVSFSPYSQLPGTLGMLSVYDLPILGPCVNEIGHYLSP